jgi:hypothetical protein
MPGRVGRTAFVDRAHAVDRVGRRREPRPERRRRAQPHVPVVEPDLAGQRGEAVAEAPVDRGLRGPQRGHRFGARRVHVVELAPHHRGQHPAAPVGGRDADLCDSRDRHLAAGHRHAPRVDRSAGDDPPAVADRERAVDLEPLGDPVDVAG